MKNKNKKVFTQFRTAVLRPKFDEDQKKEKKSFNKAGIDFCNRILFKSRVRVDTFSMPMGGYFRI